VKGWKPQDFKYRFSGTSMDDPTEPKPLGSSRSVVSTRHDVPFDPFTRHTLDPHRRREARLL
jgi:hypothetical protein